MNEAKAATIYGLPRYKSQTVQNEESTEEKRSWFFNRLVDGGVITMADSQPKPPGFYVNWTTVSGVLLILSAIVGCFTYTYNATWNAAYQKGQDDAEKKIILERLQKAEDDVKKATQLQLMNESPNSPLRHKENKK